ncbi:hypothetical protein ACQKJC_08720 [Priestia koreensis]|uniref:hypothetical protein n=1 Tax=Priestia koreensis TaxID=284581 RepID=UPI003D00F3D7
MDITSIADIVSKNKWIGITFLGIFILNFIFNSLKTTTIEKRLMQDSKAMWLDLSRIFAVSVFCTLFLFGFTFLIIIQTSESLKVPQNLSIKAFSQSMALLLIIINLIFFTSILVMNVVTKFISSSLGVKNVFYVNIETEREGEKEIIEWKISRVIDKSSVLLTREHDKDFFVDYYTYRSLDSIKMEFIRQEIEINESSKVVKALRKVNALILEVIVLGWILISYVLFVIALSNGFFVLKEFLIYFCIVFLSLAPAINLMRIKKILDKLPKKEDSTTLDASETPTIV